MQNNLLIFLVIVFIGELQWNAFKEQHIVNNLIIEISKELNFSLISTCDSHAPTKDLLIDRELYKKIGWLNKKDEKKELPRSFFSKRKEAKLRVDSGKVVPYAPPPFDLLEDELQHG